jgi:hypothetical protein
MAKFVPAGSDLVLQMHYMVMGHATRDQTSVGLVFAKRPPRERLLTLQLTNDRFVIPTGDDNYRVEVHDTLPNDATLVSFLSHMHLRGKQFEYNLIRPDGSVIETLLRVHYDSCWRLSCRLAETPFLKAGADSQSIVWYANFEENPCNPDPTQAVTSGGQTYDEMMVGVFDVAVLADSDKWHHFIRHATPTK